MKEDNNIDQGVKELLDILTEHSRNERRQQQLGAMMDRSATLTRRLHWLWAVATAVMLSVVVALSLNFVKDKSKVMVEMDEPDTKMPMEAKEPTVALPENSAMTGEEPIAETKDVAQPLVFHTKPVVFAHPVTEEKQQPLSDNTLSVEPTHPLETIESENKVVIDESIGNKPNETIENQNIKYDSFEPNHAPTNKKTDSVATANRIVDNPYRPKDRFTLRVGGEIDAYDLGSLPFPPITSHFALGFTLDYHFTENFSMGLGAEWFGVTTYRSFYSSYQERLHAIPVYADLKLNFWGKKNYSPFLEAKLGYSIPLNKVTEYYPEGEMAEDGIGIENGRGFYTDYILSGPYLSLGLGCSMKHSNLSAGVVYSHARPPGKLKESLSNYYLNLLIWGTNFYIRYDYTFAPFSDEGRHRLRQIKNGKMMNEFNGDGFQIQLNVAGGFRPWCYSAGAALEYRFPKRISIGIGADFRGVNFTSREWGSVGYFENILEGQLLSVPVYGSLKAHFLENKRFSPFVEYRLGYAFALNSLTATHWEPEFQETIYYEKRHQGRYAYLGIGVTHKHSSLSLGILGQDGHQKETRAGYTSDLSGGYMGGFPIELRYSYRIGSAAKR
jgi:hypothetical protein